MQETLEHNSAYFGQGFLTHGTPNWQSFEPLFASAFVMLLILLIGVRVRSQMVNLETAVVPDATLTLRTFIEAFLSYFYDMAKGVMDPVRAKRYFPLIGASALFVFFANVLALLPSFPVATSNLNITMGCALTVFVLFNIYGLMTNGMSYLKHLCGPVWWLSWLILPIEIISLSVRPITLAVRLMLNMAVDHLILGIFVGLVSVLVPLPIMMLGCLVVVVQTLVFTLLTCIYIGLATEHEAH
jgi:F-type H+-transporting ATPase subunit a